MPEQRTQTSAAAERIGIQMIGIEPGSEVTVAATLTPLGEGIMADAVVKATLSGQCSRCLAELRPPYEIEVNEVFAASKDFIQGDEGDGEDVPEVIDGTIDLTQAVIDAVGLDLPFNPTCEYFGLECGDDEVPAPDGVSGEEDDRPDPRWAGLEKFK